MHIPIDTIVYTYGDESWGDLLTAYDGVAITYDEMGNPLNDGTWTYTWEHGRQLASMTNGSTTWTYTYDANGMRTSRSDGTDTYTYIYNGSKLMQMTVGTNTLTFTYDGSGNPSTVTMNGVTYHYITNLQGDVIEIRNASGGLVCYYTYDAWGNVVSTVNYTGNPLHTLNPLLYRGYVYDRDTGLYYLQSRYYNPTIGRFINADALVATGQGMLGNNMFTYCLNNPVAYSDSRGTDAKVCFASDGTIDEIPWWDHSPGGGGFVYHCDNITTDYSGDKFLTQIALRHIGNFFEAWWEAYVHSNELQVQQHHQQDMAIQGFVSDRFSTPQKAGNTLALVGSGVLLGVSVDAIVKAAAAGSALGGPIGGAIGSLLVFGASICFIIAEG